MHGSLIVLFAHRDVWGSSRGQRSRQVHILFLPSIQVFHAPTDAEPSQYFDQSQRFTSKCDRAATSVSHLNSLRYYSTYAWLAFSIFGIVAGQIRFGSGMNGTWAMRKNFLFKAKSTTIRQLLEHG